MIVYNLTIKVHNSIAEEWLAWELEEHVPAVLSTGLFDGYSFHRLLDQDESDGPTFVLQYHTSSMERHLQYVMEFAPTFQREAFDKWGERFIAFRTVMEELSRG
jgi:hypothetical protein